MSKISDKIKRIFKIIIKIIKSLNITNIKKMIKLVRIYGFKDSLKKLKFVLTGSLNVNRDEEYKEWIRINEPTEEELELQKTHDFEFAPKISLVVPMYNTPINFFEELVDCLISQTYSNWELCLADGSPEKNDKIEEIVNKDERIKYKFLNENKNISGNSNEALKLATGEYIGLLDHDDLLPKFSLYEIVVAINQNPDVEFIYTDEDKIDEMSSNRFDPYFKPDFAIDTLRCTNYICHFSIFKKELMDKLGGFRSEFDGAQDHDLILRMSENTDKILHIQKVLYHWRVHKASTASDLEAKPYVVESGILAIKEHLKRLNLDATVKRGKVAGSYEIEYNISYNPKVSIIIPNKDGKDILKTCINSIIEKSTYKNYEIVIVENNSEQQTTFDYYKELEENPKVKILKYDENVFNYSKIINYGVKNCTGEFVVQLNNDTEIITPDWLEKMLGYCQRDDVGVCGAELFYPDDTIQHAGIIVGIGGIAGHRFKNISKMTHGYFAEESKIENLSSVTGACMMAKKSMYEEVGYMNEKLAVAFNDVDFCLKVRNIGKLIVYNPYVQLKHYESKTRGYEDSPEKIKRFENEKAEFMKTWEKFLNNGDPYYNGNFSCETEQYDIKISK